MHRPYEFDIELVLDSALADFAGLVVQPVSLSVADPSDGSPGMGAWDEAVPPLPEYVDTNMKPFILRNSGRPLADVGYEMDLEIVTIVRGTMNFEGETHVEIDNASKIL